MTKGKWLARALHVTIALSFILGALVVAPSVSADPGTSKWEKQVTPTDDDKVILPGSDIIDFDVTGSDGMTVYAIGTWQGDTLACLGSDYAGYTMVPGPGELWGTYQIAKFWKSTDGGVTWSDKTSKVLGAKNLPDQGTATALDWDDFQFFTAVSAAPDDPDFVVVTGWDHSYNPVVVGSNDGAGKFYYMGCSTVTGLITCVDVSMEVDDKHVIAVGTWDPTDPTYSTNRAAVWRYDAGGYWSAYWVQTGATTAAPTAGYTGWDPCDAIVDLEFSPNFDVDDSIVVLCIDEVNDSDVDAPFNDSDSDSTLDFLGFKLQAGTWNSIDAWNAAAEFDSYPVVIKNDDYSIVSPIDPTIGSGWDIGPLVRRAGDIDLPMDYMGDDNSDRKVMVVVNGVEFNMADSPTDEWIDDGGFLFWVENTTISLEMLDHEDNPYISSLDYQGNIDMEGRTLLGLMFPSSWRWEEIDAWFDGNGITPSIGCCNGVQVLRSETTDVCCPDWDYASKPPSGQFFATVMMTPDGDWAFAGTQGESRVFGSAGHTVGIWSDESAFSISGHSGDIGSCWNQESLIDTDIDFIADAVVNPACGYIYMLTINNDEGSGVTADGKVCECDSVWRSEDSGSTWLRVFHHELAGDPMDVHDYCDWGMSGGIEWGVLGLAPEEEDEVETIYLAELDTQFIWYADSSGLCKWTDRNTGLANIADIAVLDASTIYVVDFNGDLVKSTTSARHWSSIEESKVDDDSGEQAHTMVCWGDWVLLGGNMGTVSYSDDGGDSFSVLDDIGGGQVHVAFDSYFDDNGYIYGAVAGADRGVWRTTIDGADFKDMDACTSMNYFGIVLSDPDGNPKTSASTGGVLYASYNSITPNDACTDDTGTPITCDVKSGVARLLAPASSSCCGALSWDYLWDSLDVSAAFHTEPSDLAICGCLTANTDATLWAVALENESYSVTDTYFDGWNDCWTDLGASGSSVGRLWKYTDCFAKAGPALIGVDDGATIPSDPCDCVNEDFVLEWDRLCDACEYDVEIALDEAFTHKVWTTSTICATGGWSGAGCETHVNCGDMVLLPCEGTMTFYKPSDPCVPSIVVPQGTLDCNQQYWWRVRARVAETDEIYRSQWSDKWSFTVAVGPGGAIKLTAPDDGASNVPLENIVFTWTAVADATSYELTLMDASGAEVASNSGDATSFVLGSKLNYDSAYMWQVNALMGSNVLSESGTSTFRTMSKPTAPPEIPETVINFPEPVTGTPTWVWVVIALAAILIIVVIVLIFRTRRV